MLREIDVLEAGFQLTQVPVLADAYVQALSVVERCRPADDALEARLAEAILAEAQRRVKLVLVPAIVITPTFWRRLLRGFSFMRATSN